jgi:hypothetical protein
MIRLPIFNVDSRFAAFGVAVKAALSAAPNAPCLASSAEGVFGASIARRDSQRDLINRSESGSCRNDALERHSEALHIGRCGGRAVWHERDVSNIRLTARAVNRDRRRPSRKSRLVRSAGGVNARRPCGTHGRSAAESVDAAEHRVKIQARWASDQRQPGGEMRPTDRSRNPASSPRTIDCEWRRIARRFVARVRDRI